MSDAVAEPDVRVTPAIATAEPRSARIVRFLGKTPVYLFLVFIGLLWLVPTIGLFLTSLLDPSDISTTGWWQILSEPSLATLDNYREIFDNEAITFRHLDDGLGLSRRDDPPHLRRVARRVRVRLARVSRVATGCS